MTVALQRGTAADVNEPVTQCHHYDLSCMSSSNKAKANATGPNPVQAVLSSYFSQSSKSSPLRGGRQATSSPQRVDLTLDDSDSDAELWKEVGTPPPTKKRRVEPLVDKPNIIPPRVQLEKEPEGTAVQQYRFNPSPSADAALQPVNGSGERKKQQWHARAKKILLADSNVFQRRLEVSASAEEPAPSESEDEDADAIDGSQEKTSLEFEDLMTYYASSSKGKGTKRKRTTTGAGASQPTAPSLAKKTIEAGPSGKVYTPLELQVSLLSLRNLEISLTTNNLGS